MKNLKKRFQTFYHRFPYLNIKEQIENFAVFDGLDSFELTIGTNILENIEKNIIKHISTLKKDFYHDNHTCQILQKLAKGDRKQYAIYKNSNLSQIKGKEIFKKLYNEDIIQKEFSREKKYHSSKQKPLKKELRRYTVEDKLKFTKNFHRFWYTFISSKMQNKQYITTDNIKPYLEKYISFTFEELSNELIKDDYFGLNIAQSGSYWDKKTEIDILAKNIDNNYIVGECKWTNQKICKNILRKLQNKTKYIDFNVTKYALFSKNGFSNSLKKDIKDIILFEIDDFKRLNK